MRRELLDAHPSTVGTVRNGKHPGSGRFLPGNRLAARRNSRRAWQDAFNEALSPDDLRVIVRKAVEQAKRGDRHARQWIGDYALQRPAQFLSVDLADESTQPADMSDPANIDLALGV